MVNIIDVLGKMQLTLDWLTSNIDVAKLAGGEERYKHYFISYFDECCRAICKKCGVAYNDATRFLVYAEAERGYGEGSLKDQDAREKNAKAFLENIRATEAGMLGVVDGRKDGEYAAEPTNPYPYFSLARAYFGLSPAEVNKPIHAKNSSHETNCLLWGADIIDQRNTLNFIAKKRHVEK